MQNAVFLRFSDRKLSQQEAGQFPGNQMHMKMRNGLAAMHPGVDHEPEAVLGNALLLCQLFRQHDHMPHQRLITRLERIDRINVPVWNDENMRTGNGVDIAECGYLLITVNNGGRCFTGKNFTKDARHGSS